ncbi:hypothetical protein [Candidatus Pelagibacter sp.]|uniref:hypothetical protein n=1 Tax=Candidatus Pelagibacter sp. TaxID=2024849 RepID=UPI003D150F85|tara:strand:+ start:1383 stop:1616 length:234 start_codon:yes stop_codon:yes gene_type:complete
MDKRYLITEIRETRDNEFIFGCSERIVASSEIQRLLSYMRNQGFVIQKIDVRSLPTDHHGNSMVGYKIINERNKDEE